MQIGFRKKEDNGLGEVVVLLQQINVKLDQTGQGKYLNREAKASNLVLNNKPVCREKRYLSIQEVAEYTGLGVTTLYRWSNEHKMPFHKIGRVKRFDVQEVDKWLSKHKQVPTRELNTKKTLTHQYHASIMDGIRNSTEPEGVMR